MKNLLLSFFVLIGFGSFSQTGLIWGAVGDVAANSFGNDFPRVVMDGSGNPMVSWVDNGYMLFARWTGSSFSTPDTISDTGLSIAGANWMGPDIASHGDTLYAVYKETPENVSSSAVWSVRSTDGGATFGAPVQVNTFTADSLTRFPTIGTDDLGNPLVAFMEFDPGFGDARWMVAKSTDAGATYGMDVKASGWSDPASEVCDCCPGMITAQGNTVAMLYRDNDADIRDTWAGVSNDGGVSFAGGMDVDQNGWFINSCPSSGPDGFLLGDSLYTVHMNGGSGDYYTYFSSSHVPSLTGGGANQLNPIGTGNIQNYPRISNSGNMAAIVWKENSGGTNKIMLRFADDITTGLPVEMDTVAVDFSVSGDVTMSSTQVVVVWQDFNSGTVKYRFGTLPGVGISQNKELDVEVFPNPADKSWLIQGVAITEGLAYTLHDMSGKTIVNGNAITQGRLELDAEDMPSGAYILKTENGQVRLMKK